MTVFGNLDGTRRSAFSLGPTEEAIIRAVGNEIALVDAVNGQKTLSQILASATGITEAAHRTLRTLIHFIDDGPADGFATGAYKEITGTVFPTALVWWESSAKLKKIVERLVTWTGAFPTTDKWKVYSTDGSTVLWTVTDTISYSGAFETSRTRAIVSGDA